jgi:hypothetical protein
LAFVKEKTADGILDALLGRRTHAANLAPFHVRFSVDHQVVGSSVVDAKEALIELRAKAEEFDSLEVWLGKTAIQKFISLPPNGSVKFSLREVGKGPLWIKIVGKEIDNATQTPRTTITSPIWLR